MKKLLAKIRNKRLKGNISLLVILILLASSVISLLSINQIQRLMTYGNMTFNYFRAFYIAKAGTELGLTEVYNRGDGFNHEVLSGSSIVQNNLVGIYTGFNPFFDMTITGSFTVLTDDIRDTNCSGNKIKLATGAGIMLSLFSDNSNDIAQILSGYTGISPLLDGHIKDLKIENVEWDGEPVHYFTFGLFDYNDSGEMDNIVVATGTYDNFHNFLSNNIDNMNGTRRYLTIKNPGTGNEVVEFCITMHDHPIPYSNSIITVFGHYGDMEVGLQSVIKKGVPDWTLNVLGNQAGSS